MNLKSACGYFELSHVFWLIEADVPVFLLPESVLVDHSLYGVNRIDVQFEYMFHIFVK